MFVTSDPLEAYAWAAQQSKTYRVALVPTMGALHDGHLSLVRRARELAEVVAVTIFVNPTQFAPHEDLARYPRPLEQDIEMVRSAGAAMVFHPSDHAIYPPGFSTYVNPPAVASRWEGVIRPDHFRGVCTVVLKLFQIIPAQVAVFGRKDYQQSMVIRAMARDFNLPIQIEVADTIREPDGLAMSSRNRYLTPDQRLQALSLSRALRMTRQQALSGVKSVTKLERVLTDELAAGSDLGVDSIDYAAVVDAHTLEPFSDAILQPNAVALVAARVGTTRLIDNLSLTPDFATSMNDS